MNNFMQRNQYPSYFNSTSVVNTTANNIIWVQGIEGAKAWQLAPNSMVILLDSETDGKMYIKVSDSVGFSTLRIFNYTEEIPSSTSLNNQGLDLSQYVRKDELNNLIKELIANEQPVQTVAPATSNDAAKHVITVKK